MQLQKWVDLENQLKGSSREKALLDKMPHKNAHNSILAAAESTTCDHILFLTGQIKSWEISLCLSHHNCVFRGPQPWTGSHFPGHFDQTRPSTHEHTAVAWWTGRVSSCHASYCFPGFLFDFTAMLILLKSYDNHP